MAFTTKKLTETGAWRSHLPLTLQWKGRRQSSNTMAEMEIHHLYRWYRQEGSSNNADEREGIAVVRLPALHHVQQMIVAQAARFNVLCLGRRAGKTVLGIDRLVETALAGAPAAWMSPTYRMMGDVWRNVREVLAPVVARCREQERRLELTTGGSIDMWSLETPDAIRGRKYRRVIIDEAAMVRGLAVAWQQIIRPTLTDLIGDAWLLSTPRGRGFFWECWQHGQDSSKTDWRSWQLPTSSNPYIPPDELEALRAELPERVYLQEIEAQFLDDGGGVFRRISEAASAVPVDEPVDGHSYVVGVDWGRSGDATCFAIVDITTHSLVVLERCTNMAFETQLARLKGLMARFEPTVVVAETNSLGMPLVEQLERDGYPVQPFHTTNRSKQQLIDALVLAFEQNEISILNDEVLLRELHSFEMERLPSGAVRYGAAVGEHDDCVMALALAWSAARESGPVVVW